jgi:hypothetical protein
MKSTCVIFLLISSLVLRSQCNNSDFEATPAGAYTLAVAGWSISSCLNTGCGSENWAVGASEFSVVTTPVSFPGVGTLPHSPFGGTKVARLNNYTNNSAKTRISSTFTVTPANTLFKFAFAVYFSGTGDCCYGTGMRVQMTTCSSSVVPCGTFSIIPACDNSGTTYSTSNGQTFTSWQVKSIDLTPYLGSCVTIEVTCFDNVFGGSFACAAFDAQCSSAMGPNITPLGNGPSPVSFCAGGGIANISAPPGYSSYSWTATGTVSSLPANQATLSTVTITNPVAGSVYTVLCTNPGLCSTSFSYSLATTQVSVAGIGMGNSCAGGSAGSATVHATGSSLGYSYQWTNSTSSVVSTSSVAVSLPPGTYNVAVSASGSISCGTASTSVTILSASIQPTYLYSPFCGGTAYLSAPAGNSYQWYQGATAIQGATLATRTFTNAVSNSIVEVGFNRDGCRDSVIFTLIESAPGPIGAITSGSGCFGTTGASAVLSFTPVGGGGSTSTYTFVSAGNFTPAFLQTGTMTSVQSFSTSGLVFGASYSLSIFDGLCRSNSLIVVAPPSPSFAVVPGPPSGTICSGQTVSAYAAITQPASQYSFLWSPSLFLASGNSTLQTVSISPTVSPGSSGSMIYTIVVTPTAINCPVTATYAIQFLQPPVPQIVPLIPNMCIDDPATTISTGPPGGTLTPAPFQSGVFTPSVLGAGNYTVVYSVSSGSCIASTDVSFIINPLPQVSIGGNQPICKNDTLTLYGNGAFIYNWSNNQQGNSMNLIPQQNSTFSVVGTQSLTGCKASAVVNVTVWPLPTVKSNGDFTICPNTAVTLSAGGANSYSWSTGATQSSLVVKPQSTTVYLVFGYDQTTGCMNSDTSSVTVLDCTGISEFNQLSEGLYVYPNPFTDRIVAELNYAAEARVYDHTGKLIRVAQLGAGKNVILLDDLAPGVYIMRVINRQRSQNVKMIKAE